ncbi:hypothetical protein [Mesobacillus jeotgali]|jgi:hypothetical protein|uniref:Lipoprotein n=1 Tax=Mesobacillus jeotgali TaxID=129985 RepID=A0ABY9VL46_9BACI|nr:hypothetical protein [Mesobacillus jeotgali]WNF24635.1 hypothetical protein RH061_09170 [Mesobacillus jeotgali]
MRKFFIGLIVLIAFGAGCNNFEPELTRIDVQKMTEEGMNDGEEQIIASKERLIKIQKSLEEVKWSPKTKAEMSRKEDVLATFFIQEEKNMPERLYQYRIWFEGETATLISEKENEGYGRLTDKAQISLLESELLSEE